jgi:transposase
MNTLSSKLLNFTDKPIYIGLDVHKKSWSVTLHSDEFELKTFTQPPKPDVLANYLNQHYPGAQFKALYEAGFSGFWVQRELSKLGICCHVIHPADVPTSDKEKRQKADKIDSRKLSRACKAEDYKAIYIPSEAQQEERNLLRARQKIIKDITRVKNRIKFYLMYQGVETTNFKSRKWTKEYVSFIRGIKLTTPSGTLALQTSIEEMENLEKQAANLDLEVKKLSKTDRYKENADLLRSVPSIGIISAMTLLTEIGDIKRFKTFDELCSFFGLIPNTHSSGEKSRVGHMTRRGNNLLKSILIECSWIAIRNDPALLQCYKELTVRMNGNKAIIRIARRLLSRINHVLIKKEKYQTGILN